MISEEGGDSKVGVIKYDRVNINLITIILISHRKLNKIL